MSFNVEEYLDSLPSDVEEINVSGKSITRLPNLSRFTNLKILLCGSNKLTELPPLPETLRRLCCSHNYLTSLPPLNRELKILSCKNNKLTSLPRLNSKLRQLMCFNNELTYLPRLNSKLLNLKCSHNKITSLPRLNRNLLELNCSHNKITSIPELNNRLRLLICSYNELTSFPALNENLYGLVSHNNKNLPEILMNKEYTYREYGHIPHQKRDAINKLAKIRFRLMCLKYKKQFRDWLWERVRRPKIEQAYTPTKLIQLLASLDEDCSEDEEDRVIENW